MTAEDIAIAFTTLSGEDALNVERLVGGSPNPSWGVTTATSRYAVRLYPPAWGEVQTSFLRFLGAERYPVPSVVYSGDYGDRWLLAVAWVSGQSLAEALTAAPEQADALGSAFGRLHAELHRLLVPPSLSENLPKLRGIEAGTALLHLDYHPLNALVENGAFSGIIDWDNVRLGDPRADVARTLSIFAIDPAVQALPPDVRKVVRIFRRAYCSGYSRVAGKESLLELAPFLARAGDFMLRDLETRYDAVGLGPVRRWTKRWKSRR